MKINFKVLGTFFYRKKVPNLPKTKSSYTQFKTLGRCPKPHHLLKKVDENFSIRFAGYI
jgi:hypothetical protein